METILDSTSPYMDAKTFEIRRLDGRPWAKDWGHGDIEDAEAIRFVATGYGRKATLVIGKVLGGRQAYGQNRVRFHVARGSHVIVEFTGADDYASTGRVFSILKRLDGTVYTQPGEVPEQYSHFSVEPIRNLVHDGRRYRGLAVVLQENDFENMVRYALQRLIDRQRLLPRFPSADGKLSG